MGGEAGPLFGLLLRVLLLVLETGAPSPKVVWPRGAFAPGALSLTTAVPVARPRQLDPDCSSPSRSRSQVHLAPCSSDPFLPGGIFSLMKLKLADRMSRPPHPAWASETFPGQAASALGKEGAPVHVGPAPGWEGCCFTEFLWKWGIEEVKNAAQSLGHLVWRNIWFSRDGGGLLEWGTVRAQNRQARSNWSP